MTWDQIILHKLLDRSLQTLAGGPVALAPHLVCSALTAGAVSPSKEHTQGAESTLSDTANGRAE